MVLEYLSSFQCDTVRAGSVVSDKDVKEKNYSTQTSRVVTHRTTIWASTCLTSQIGRDAVLSRVYGRRY
jgi:hypothetical protein